MFPSAFLGNRVRFLSREQYCHTVPFVVWDKLSRASGCSAVPWSTSTLCYCRQLWYDCKWRGGVNGKNWLWKGNFYEFWCQSNWFETWMKFLICTMYWTLSSQWRELGEVFLNAMFKMCSTGPLHRWCLSVETTARAAVCL